jgi:hypothetical protein
VSASAARKTAVKVCIWLKYDTITPFNQSMRQAPKRCLKIRTISYGWTWK